MRLQELRLQGESALPLIYCQYLNGKLGSKLANLGLWLLLVLPAVVIKELLPWRHCQSLLILVALRFKEVRPFSGHHPKWVSGKFDSKPRTMEGNNLREVYTTIPLAQLSNSYIILTLS